MAISKRRARIATVLFISGAVMTGAVRDTPDSWFPWDIYLALALMVAGAVVIAARNRSD